MLRTRHGIDQLEARIYAYVQFAPFLNCRICDAKIM
jgi:hypothetical protein